MGVVDTVQNTCEYDLSRSYNTQPMSTHSKRERSDATSGSGDVKQLRLQQRPVWRNETVYRKPFYPQGIFRDYDNVFFVN